MAFEQWPYTNIQNLNLDWILEKLRGYTDNLDAYIATDAIKIADPITYQPGNVYIKHTIVTYLGAAYISNLDTPANITPANNTYWQCLGTLPATEAEIKAGASAGAVTAGTQDLSTFYSLAKAAGVDLAGQQVTPGQYPEEAKVAIQKMLGVYQAPWELIAEEDNIELNNSAYTIQSDQQGDPLSLSDAVLFLKAYPGCITNSGIIFINDSYGIPNINQLDGSITGNRYAIIEIIDLSKANNLKKISSIGWTTIRYYTGLRITATMPPEIVSNKYRDSYILSDNFILSSFSLPNITGTIQFKLYGRRIM